MHFLVPPSPLDEYDHSNLSLCVCVCVYVCVCVGGGLSSEAAQSGSTLTGPLINKYSI